MLKYAYIGSENISDREDVYDVIATAFDFPDYFGRNLDALYDCLTESSEDRLIVLTDTDYLTDELGAFYTAFYKVMSDAAADNNSLKIRVL